MTVTKNIANAPKAVGSHRDGSLTSTRSVLRRAWNHDNAIGVINGNNRVVTPFRAVNNLGDFLARKNYVCGGPNQVSSRKPGKTGPIGSIISSCDGKGVEGYSGNVKFVPDSSDYITYKKQRAMNRNYNDSKH
tara:strand:- start:2085 stop:2483 length:399 start_codon:yes stop_codon:yes gene_type:complete